MNASFDIIRTGKHYLIINFGEEWRFEVLEIMANGDFRIRMIDTLEEQFLGELIAYGQGPDFTFDEL